MFVIVSLKFPNQPRENIAQQLEVMQIIMDSLV